MNHHAYYSSPEEYIDEYWSAVVSLAFGLVVDRPTEDNPTGVVALLDRQGKRTHQKLSFDAAAGSFVTTKTGSIPIWMGSTQPHNGELLMINPPPRGTSLVLDCAEESGKVMRWGYAASFMDARHGLCSNKHYRVVLRDRIHKDLTGEIWNGRDIHELSVRYELPYEHHPDGLSFGDAHLGYRIEIDLKGTWRRARHDPRIPICCVPRSEFLRFNVLRDEPLVAQPKCRHRQAA